MARDELCEDRIFIITTQAANDIEPPAAAAPQRANSQKQNIKIDPCRDRQGGEALIIVQTITHKAFLRVHSYGTH